MTTETVTPPATPVTPPPAAPAQTDWTSGLPDDVKGYVQNKGFKDPHAVVDSYRNLEKLIGAPRERLLTLPEKEDAPEWAQVFDKLGRPANAKDYKLEVPKELGDDKFVDFLKDTFHANGLSSRQAEAVMKKYGEYFSSEVEAAKSGMVAQLEAEQNALKKEWGAAHEQNIGVARKAAAAFGLNEEALDKLEVSLGYQGLMKFMHNIGSKLGEHNFVGGGDNGFKGALTPQQAKSRINDLRGDPEFSRRYLAGELAAKQEMEKLHKWAYAE